MTVILSALIGVLFGFCFYQIKVNHILSNCLKMLEEASLENGRHIIEIHKIFRDDLRERSRLNKNKKD